MNPDIRRGGALALLTMIVVIVLLCCLAFVARAQTAPPQPPAAEESAGEDFVIVPRAALDEAIALINAQRAWMQAAQAEIARLANELERAAKKPTCGRST